MNKNFCIILAFILLQINGAYSQPNKKVVLIILDGIPADVIQRVSTPALDQIALAGSFSLAQTGGTPGTSTESPTISAVGYNHVLTGTWSDTHQVWTNDIKHPNYDAWNIFRIAEAQDDDMTTAIYSTWLDNRTKLVGDQNPAAGGFEIDFSFDGLEYDTIRYPHDRQRRYILAIDQEVATQAARHIMDTGPDVAWVYLEYTDDMGHMHGDSEQMDQAVIMADDMVQVIWGAIQQREQQGDDYLLLITTDHGRDALTGRSHGGQSDRERLVWVVSNKAIASQQDGKITHIDILPSIITFMGFEVPSDVSNQWEGHSFLSTF